MIVKCDYCNQLIEKKSSELKKSTYHFCNKKCHNDWMKEKGPRGENHPLYKKIRIKCEYCGEIKIKDRKHYKKSHHHFCNQECYIAWMTNRKPYNYSRIKINCDFCNKQILIKRCHLKTYNYHFCNSRCFGDWKSKTWSGENSVFWKGGISFEPYSKEFNNNLKKYIRLRDNYSCQLCGIPENRQTHICHHIDYNKKNNKSNNLLLLCRPCNSKVNHNRTHWIKCFKGIK